MASTQNIVSPRPPRVKHAKSANQAPPNNNGNKSQRRPKGNRASSAQQQKGGAAFPASQSLIAQDLAAADSAALLSEDQVVPNGPRNPKKHTHSQPSGDRLFSPRGIAASSLTDAEVGHTNTAATPAKAQAAYAGPTFHASPAPSALPIPKFLSKSVPAKVRPGPPTPPPDEGSDSGSSPILSPSRAPIPVPPRQQNSHLDLLFKADKAERARNTNGSPASGVFHSPNPSSGNGRPHYVKHYSHNSLGAPFPIELDGDDRSSFVSPPVASPPASHRPITAPSNFGYDVGAARPNDSSVQELLNRLSMSQKLAPNATPPRHVEHMPSDPSLRNTPPSANDDRSPFRSASGPTTPAPPVQEGPDFFYGNRNLSPLFKQAKSDVSKRNSGLRTEVTADSPMLPQGGFPLLPAANIDTRGLLGNVLNDPTSPRRGSAPHVQPMQPYRGSPNHHNARSPARRPPRPRPDSFSYANANGAPNRAPNATPPTLQKASSAMSFVPSSVRAKPQPSPPPKKNSDSAALEQDLKRMLSL